MTSTYTLRELAEQFSASFYGDPDCRIARVAPLESAGAGCIAFLANPKYKSLLATTGATAVILAPEHMAVSPVPVLVSDNPYALYARISMLLMPPEEIIWDAAVHPSAVIHRTAHVHASVVIGPNVVIEADVEIAENCTLSPGCVIQRGCRVGANTYLHANVTLCKSVVVGARALIHSGAVIGSDGFGFAREGGDWIKVPQIGTVRIGDDVEIGACVSIDRGSNRDTVIGAGVKLDNLIHIGHNVSIGARTAIAAMTGIAGSSSIGEDCTIGGRVSIVGHVIIPDRTHINACSVVTHSIKESGSYSSGTPLEESASWRRNWVRFKQLDDMAKRIKALEIEIRNLVLTRGDPL